MTRLFAILLSFILLSCARHDIENIEKEAKRIEDIVCPLKSISEMEGVLKNEGFELRGEPGRIIGVRKIPNEGASLVTVSIVAMVGVGVDGTNAGCTVTALAKGS